MWVSATGGTFLSHPQGVQHQGDASQRQEVFRARKGIKNALSPPVTWPTV